MRYLLPILLLLAGCEPKPENEYTNFSFQIPLQINAGDTVAVGDTIWVTANFSDQLREVNSGNTYPVTPQNFELRNKLGLYKLVDKDKTLATQPSGTGEFIFVDRVGYITNMGTTYSSIKYAYSNNSYNLRIGLIPKIKGIFCVSFLDGWDNKSRDQSLPSLSYLVPGRTPDGGKRYAVFDTFWFYINEGRTNFDLYKQHCLAISLNVPTANNINGEQEGTFTFVVK